MENLCELCREEKYHGKPCTYEKASKYCNCDSCGKLKYCNLTWSISVPIHLNATSADLKEEKNGTNDEKPKYQTNMNGSVKVDFQKLSNPSYYYNQKQNNMEKQIKMSLETAREIADELNKKANSQILSASEKAIKKILYENFTEQELYWKKKGFTWEDSFNRGGYYITTSSVIANDGQCEINNINKNLFRTEEQAESALAFAQLSHICEKYNENKYATTKDGHTIHYYIEAYNNSELRVVSTTYFSCVLPMQRFLFCTLKDAETSLEVNRELWNKYWMIK